eukprot:UN09700
MKVMETGRQIMHYFLEEQSFPGTLTHLMMMKMLSSKAGNCAYRNPHRPTLILSLYPVEIGQEVTSHRELVVEAPRFIIPRLEMSLRAGMTGSHLICYSMSVDAGANHLTQRT